ncbi:S-layer homology domain-containing protein [Tumebacillus sp. BK434]|uniref:S-layer homology domain-containing protein n=1 Tax=Tumebacillus sp. BK434 TaxID=2512169 RepID=UPI0014043CDC|nr:S-layer homology domain-containing protein [Tumebacillus sp. BK434]
MRRRFTSSLLVVTLAAGIVVVPAPDLARAAVGNVTFTLSSPLENGKINRLTRLDGIAVDPDGDELQNGGYLIKRLSDGKFMQYTASANPADFWVADGHGGYGLYKGENGQYYRDLDAWQIDALYEEGEYEIRFNINEWNGTEMSSNFKNVRFTIDKTAPRITGPVLSDGAIVLNFSEPLAGGAALDKADFEVLINGTPAVIDFVAPDEQRTFAVMGLSSGAHKGDIVTVRYAPQGMPATDAAGNALSSEAVAVDNRLIGSFQSVPQIDLPKRAGYTLQAGDDIVTFSPTDSLANQIIFEFPTDGDNRTSIQRLALKKSDLVLWNNTDETQIAPAAIFVAGDDYGLTVLLPDGVVLEEGKSYTLALSGTAGGDEITLLPTPTTAAGASLITMGTNGIADLYTFANLEFAPYVPPAKTPAPDLEKVTVINNSLGADVLIVDGVGREVTVKVYDQAVGGSVLASMTQGAEPGRLLLTVGDGIALPTVYIAAQAPEMAESSRVAVTVPGIVQKELLRFTLQGATTLYMEAVEGVADGQYPLGAKAELQTAIQAGLTVLNGTLYTQADVLQALGAIDEAVEAFRAKKIVIPGGGTPVSPPTTVPSPVLKVVENGVVLGTLPLTRKTDATGRVTDQVDITDAVAADLVARLKAAGANALHLVFAEDKASNKAAKLTLSANAADRLADAGLSVNVSLFQTQAVIPAASLKAAGQTVEFEIAPVTAQSDVEAVKQRAASNADLRKKAGNGVLTVLGVPVSIETNLPQLPVKLFLPLDGAALSEEQKQDTGIYIEHSDGGKELVQGRFVTNAAGVSGIELSVDRFSLFTIVQVEGWGTLQPYLTGYDGGLFKPDAAITRAELAAILAKVIRGEAWGGKSAFSDVADLHWAKRSIERVGQLGLMQGDPDGKFHPERTITRAEMAAIIAAWLPSQNAAAATAGARAFSDLQGHWAASSIERAHLAGIVNGYQDGTYRPEQALSRAEAAVLVNKLLGRAPELGAVPKFHDVPSAHWAFGAIQAAGK